MSPARPVVVVFVPHAMERILERGFSLTDASDAVLSAHHRRRRNPGRADWLLRERGLVIAYDWPDGDDTSTAVVVSVWPE